MTEFESASLAVQEASLALQETSLALQEFSLALQEVAAVVAGLNALAAVIAAIGIWWGIRAMIQANDERARQHRETMDRQREAMDRQREVDDQRHAEAMGALNELIRAGQRQHEATMQAFQRQGAALEALLARPSPPPPAAE